MTGLPEHPEFATTFSDWVFKQTYPAAASREAGDRTQTERMHMGTLGHQAIIDSICRTENIQRRFLPRDLKPEKFRIVYADTNTGNDQRTFLASTLRVGGIPMRCRPDLVLRHQATSAYMIVELKVSALPTRSWSRRDGSVRAFDPDGYPNNRAQLWAYSKIDDYKDMHPLFLVLQFRDPQTLQLKHTKVWACPDPLLEQEARGYFEQYSALFPGPTEAR
jgi:hypothetical protein